MTRRPDSDQAAALDPLELISRLRDALGATLVAALAGARSVDAPVAWLCRELVPSAAAMERLRFAYRQWCAIAAVEGGDVARVWFFGANPWLEGDTPVNAIREGRFSAVSAATNAMVDDSFGG